MKIAVSACLLGENCKYNGGNNKCDEIIKLGENTLLYPFAPNALQGLKYPDCPAK